MEPIKSFFISRGTPPMKIKTMIQLATQGVILVLPIGRQKFPRYFKGYLDFFAIFNCYFVSIYSKILRRIPKDIQRNPGWETLVEFVQRLVYGLDNGKIVALISVQVRGPSFQKKTSRPSLRPTWLLTLWLPGSLSLEQYGRKMKLTILLQLISGYIWLTSWPERQLYVYFYIGVRSDKSKLAHFQYKH